MPGVVISLLFQVNNLMSREVSSSYRRARHVIRAILPHRLPITLVIEYVEMVFEKNLF